MPDWLQNVQSEGEWIPGGEYTFQVWEEVHSEFIGDNKFHEWGLGLRVVGDRYAGGHCFFRNLTDTSDDYEVYITILEYTDYIGSAGWATYKVKVDANCPIRTFYLKYEERHAIGQIIA